MAQLAATAVENWDGTGLCVYAKRLERGPDPSPDDLERPVAFGTIPEDCEIIVEGGDSLKPEALDHDEARTVDDREVLIQQSLAYGPRTVEVGGRDGVEPSN